MRKYQNISLTISFLMLAMSMTLLLVDFTEDMEWFETVLSLSIAFFVGIQISIRKAAERYVEQNPIHQNIPLFFVPRKGNLPELRIDASTSRLIYCDEGSAVFFNKGHFFGCTVNNRGSHNPTVVWNQDLAPDAGLVYDDIVPLPLLREFIVCKGDDYYAYTIKKDLVSNAKNYVPSSWFSFDPAYLDKETVFTVKREVDKEAMERSLKENISHIHAVLQNVTGLEVIENDEPDL